VHYKGEHIGGINSSRVDTQKPIKGTRLISGVPKRGHLEYEIDLNPGKHQNLNGPRGRKLEPNERGKRDNYYSRKEALEDIMKKFHKKE
jgi:hypothetical protein